MKAITNVEMELQSIRPHLKHQQDQQLSGQLITLQLLHNLQYPQLHHLQIHVVTKKLCVIIQIGLITDVAKESF